MLVDKIGLNVGSGGRQMQDFIKEVILKKLGNNILNVLDDSAVITMEKGRIAMTSDSYVVSPAFFKGGDIGRLCICGTVNDLATSGAKAKYISLSFIIEEGTSLADIEKIVDSVSITAKEAGVMIVTGDTKVVEKGRCDLMYINTTGIGVLDEGVSISTHNAVEKDVVMVTGPIGDHEASLVIYRKLIDLNIDIKSDVAPLNLKIEELIGQTKGVHAIKDPTRGGLSGSLNEIADNSNCEIEIFEDKVPFSNGVKALCDIVGFDPFYLASEGRYVIVGSSDIEPVVKKVFGNGASVIGRVNSNKKRGVVMHTELGGLRKLGVMDGIQLPRIC